MASKVDDLQAELQKLRDEVASMKQEGQNPRPPAATPQLPDAERARRYSARLLRDVGGHEVPKVDETEVLRRRLEALEKKLG